MIFTYLKINIFEQQCIQVTVETEEEYFFVMTADLAVKSKWIYLHQKQRSLCLHKLDKTLS